MQKDSLRLECLSRTTVRQELIEAAQGQYLYLAGRGTQQSAGSLPDTTLRRLHWGKILYESKACSATPLSEV